ncbi:protein kilB [Streptomyces sp. NPDC056169]|uniref:protein kilB n=1 Tax=Streptomyces sp. NPDC056169 TaxID=3345734 RepID=UPI0035D6D660
MITAIVAVLGTLAGALLTGALQHFSQRAQRTTAEATTRRNEGIAAVSELATALADHRRAMWVREDLRLRGEDWTDARTASHATRSAITAPLLRVSILLPGLAPTAQDAADATYALRNVPDQTSLNAQRANAIEASDHLVITAGPALNA